MGSSDFCLHNADLIKQFNIKHISKTFKQEHLSQPKIWNSVRGKEEKMETV